MTYPRRNEYCHLARAARDATLVAILACIALASLARAALAALLLAATGAPTLALATLLPFTACAVAALIAATLLTRRAARHLHLANRNRIGADSEDEISATLASLTREGWRMQRSLNWPGTGDVDNALLSPDGGVAFAIEAKTRHYAPEHLTRVHAQATWLCRRHACRAGAVPVLALARRRGIERVEQGVLVVSRDRLAEAVRVADSAARRSICDPRHPPNQTPRSRAPCR